MAFLWRLLQCFFNWSCCSREIFQRIAPRIPRIVAGIPPRILDLISASISYIISPWIPREIHTFFFHKFLKNSCLDSFWNFCWNRSGNAAVLYTEIHWWELSRYSWILQNSYCTNTICKCLKNTARIPSRISWRNPSMIFVWISKGIFEAIARGDATGISRRIPIEISKGIPSDIPGGVPRNFSRNTSRNACCETR